MPNYIGKIVEMLGVKFGEEFGLSSNDLRSYRFTKNGLEQRFKDLDTWSLSHCEVLDDILMGDAEIVKIENKNVNNENKKEKIMDKSYYCKLAEMLGVELNKNFYIGDDREHRYKITKYGFHVINNDSMFYEDASLNDLLLVFKGEEEIIKNEMWIPENDEKYFVSDLLNSDLIHEYTWRGDEFDCNMYDRGLIFKTKEEAIKMSKKMLAMLKERRNLA